MNEPLDSFETIEKESYIIVLTKVSILSFLIFCTVHFLQVCYYLRFPDFMTYEIKVGLPFTFFYRIWVDPEAPNWGTDGITLVGNALIYWSVTLVVYQVWNNRK